MRISTGTLLVITLLAALALRVVVLGYVVRVDRPLMGDEIDYHALASNIAAGEGYRLADGQVTARRPPLYPLVLAGLYRVFGPDPAVARFFQVCLGTLIVWLVFLVARRFFDVKTAGIASILTAVNPFLAFVSGYLLTENLYAVILLLALLCIPKPALEWRRVIATALLLGLCSLARPTAVGVALWIALFAVVLGHGSRLRRLVRGAVFVLLVGVILLPWGARNSAAFGRWLFTTTHGGITFYQGNNAAVLEYPQYYGGVAPLYMLPGYDALEKMPELEKDAKAKAMGTAFLRQNKDKLPKLLWHKFVRFWRFRSDMGMSGIKSGWWFNKNSRLGRLVVSLDVGFVYAVVVIPLFVIGLALSFGGWRRYVHLYGLVVLHTAAALVFFGSIRMRVPIEPLIAMFAAYTVHRLVDRVGYYRANRSAGSNTA